jgi:phosphoglycolate phosphatase-like HAD superfamily hydrolase
MLNKLKNIETVIFDMDGVVTSEKYYWISSALTAMEIFYSKDYLGIRRDYSFEKDINEIIDDSKIFVNDAFISDVKNRSINTNWDLAFFSISLFLIEVLKPIKNQEVIEVVNKNGITKDTLILIGKNINRNLSFKISNLQKKFFFKNSDIQGFEYIEALNNELLQTTQINSKIFSRDNPFWNLTHDIFQEWFLGTELLKKNHSKKLSYFNKDGMLSIEKPIVELDKINSMFKKLYGKYRLGIATGRPYHEIIVPLEKWGLLEYFEKEMIATHQEVDIAQKELKPISLSKPHPFTFLKSIFFDKINKEIIKIELPLENREKYLIVTDSVSDIKIAQQLGCISIVVLTGVINKEQKEGLLSYNPDYVINDVSEVSSLI